jgi:hypothetical protein
VRGTVKLDVRLDQELATLTVTDPRPTVPVLVPRVEVILAVGRTMGASLEGRTRLEVVRDALVGAVKEPTAAPLELGVRVYGALPQDREKCQDTELSVPFTPVQHLALDRDLGWLLPAGGAPLGAALAAAGEDLTGKGPASLVVIADGPDRCGTDPCAVVTHLAREGVLGRSLVIGVGIEADRGPALECLGRLTGTTNQAELVRALREALHEAALPLRGRVAVYRAQEPHYLVAVGGLGERLTLPTGHYDVVLRRGTEEMVWHDMALSGTVTVPYGPTPPCQNAIRSCR